MRFLLDTHVWLWTLIAPQRISADIMVLLTDPEHTLLLSTASAWEIAIKYRLGKLPLPQPPVQFVPPRLLRDGIEVLPVTLRHALAVADLPMHHNDPFDRMLVAQAQLEELMLVTADPKLALYDLNVRML